MAKLQRLLRRLTATRFASSTRTGTVSMVFQLDDVYQYLASRFDDRLLLVVIPLNCRTRRQMRFQKLTNRRRESGTTDDAAVFGIGKSFDRLQFGHLVDGPDEPDFFHALLLIKLQPG